MSRRHAHRRHSYGRRQHELRERRSQYDIPSWLLDDSGSAGGGELGADRLRRPGFEPPAERAA